MAWLECRALAEMDFLLCRYILLPVSTSKNDAVAELLLGAFGQYLSVHKGVDVEKCSTREQQWLWHFLPDDTGSQSQTYVAILDVTSLLIHKNVLQLEVHHNNACTYGANKCHENFFSLG